MSITLTIIPARRWRHAPSGQTASIYGACPWVAPRERNEWSVESCGWTWERESHRGSVSVGLGRQPAETAREAQRIAVSIAERMPGYIIRYSPDAIQALALEGMEVADLSE